MSIGNPDKGFCPSCRRGLMEPIEVCVSINEECSDACDYTPAQCKHTGHLVEGAKCSDCGYITKEIE